MTGERHDDVWIGVGAMDAEMASQARELADLPTTTDYDAWEDYDTLRNSWPYLGGAIVIAGFFYGAFTFFSDLLRWWNG